MLQVNKSSVMNVYQINGIKSGDDGPTLISVDTDIRYWNQYTLSKLPWQKYVAVIYWIKNSNSNIYIHMAAPYAQLSNIIVNATCATLFIDSIARVEEQHYC